MRIYNKVLSQEDVTNSYNADKRSIENNENNISRNNLVLEYSVNNSNKFELKSITDVKGNIKADLYNVTLNDLGNGLEFNGSNSYAKIESLSENLEFPLSLELTIEWPQKLSGYGVVFYEPNSGITFGIWDNYINVTIGEKSNLIEVPADFYSKGVKNIIINYTSLTDYKMYINGNEIPQLTTKDRWLKYSSPIIIGSRAGSYDYFKGTLYELKIYNKILKNNEINSEYQKAINRYQK